MTRVVLVPGVLALLPEYAGIEDPVAELRAAAIEAVGWLGADVEVRGDEQGQVAAYLLDARPGPGRPTTERCLSSSSANGSAKRTEKAPGHLDERAEAFDAALGASLRAGEPQVDAALAEELWADVAALEGLERPGRGPGRLRRGALRGAVLGDEMDLLSLADQSDADLDRLYATPEGHAGRGCGST